MFAHDGRLALAPEIIDPQIAAVGPAQLLQRLQKRCRTVLRVRIVGVDAGDHADAPHALLRARGERPRNGRRRRAAKHRDELAPPHSITSSARASTVGGTVEAERLGGLEIDHQLVLGRRLHRQVGRLLALEDAVDVAGRAPVLVDEIRSIGDQTAAGDVVARVSNHGQLVADRQRGDQVAMQPGQRARRHDQAAVRRAAQRP